MLVRWAGDSVWVSMEELVIWTWIRVWSGEVEVRQSVVRVLEA